KKKVKLDVDTGDFKGLSSGLQKELKSMSKLKFKVDPIDFAKTRQKVQKETDSIAKTIQNSLKGVNAKDSQKWAGQFTSNVESQLKKSVAEQEKYVKKINDLREKSFSSKDHTNPYQEAFNSKYSRSKELTEMKSYYEEQEKVYAQIDKIRQKANSGQFELNTAKNNNFLSKYTGQSSDALDKAKKQIKEVESLQKELQSGTYASGSNKGMKLIPEDEISKAKQLDNTMKQLKISTQTVDQSMKAASSSFSKFDAISSANRTGKFLKDNTKLSKELRAELEGIERQQRETVNTGDKAKLTELDKQYRAVKSYAELSGQTGKSFGSEFKRAFGQIGQFVGIYGVLQKGVQTAGQMAKAVLDVDTAMTELRKVSDASDIQLNEQFDKASVSAQKYGASISDVINTTADWSRLGYGLKDASKLADATTMLQRVGDNMTQESSSEGLISILKGFQKDASEADSIVDKINEVANNEPIDTAGITAALQRSASSLSAAGNTIDESIGMITAANSVVQDPESVGTAFKTMSMRIRGKHKCPSYSNVCPLSQYKLVA
ncbi:MAG: phage tail tape measure protein, partial [Bacteroidaceae bacterium]